MGFLRRRNRRLDRSISFRFFLLEQGLGRWKSRNRQETGQLEDAITPDGVYKLVRAYSAALGFEIGAHSLRATAATNALDH